MGTIAKLFIAVGLAQVFLSPIAIADQTDRIAAITAADTKIPISPYIPRPEDMRSGFVD